MIMILFIITETFKHFLFEMHDFGDHLSPPLSRCSDVADLPTPSDILQYFPIQSLLYITSHKC